MRKWKCLVSFVSTSNGKNTVSLHHKWFLLLKRVMCILYMYFTFVWIRVTLTDVIKLGHRNSCVNSVILYDCRCIQSFSALNILCNSTIEYQTVNKTWIVVCNEMDEISTYSIYAMWLLFDPIYCWNHLWYSNAWNHNCTFRNVMQ